MCDTCPCASVSSIPGPVDVAARAARNKGARRVMFWGFAVPMLPFAVWGVFGWWTIALVALAAAASGTVLACVRGLHRRVVMPPPTAAQRYAELERRRRNAIPIPQPRQARRPVALPRGLSIWRRRALPVAAKALPAAVVTGRVVPPGERVAR